MELKDTVDLMLSDNWKDRLRRFGLPCLAEWNRSSGDISKPDKRRETAMIHVGDIRQLDREITTNKQNIRRRRRCKMGSRAYLVNYEELCGIKSAASYGKACPRLSETERIMCDCAEMDIEDAESYFRSKRIGYAGFAFVIFRDCELKVPALEHAARDLRTDQVAAAIGFGIAPAESDFPEFSEAIEVKLPSGDVYYTWHANKKEIKHAI